MNNDEAYLYDAGIEIGMDKADDDYTVKLKAVYEEPPVDVKYAVSIYGIKQDKINEPGKLAALTFGPAINGTKSYVEDYQACEGTSEANPNRTIDGHKCMHWMTWSEIIAQANTDPTVFEPCLKNGCTHSVELRLDEKIKSEGIKKNPLLYSDITGDGATALANSINTSYRVWNSEEDTTGGWPASKIRTTLNGLENCIPDTNSAVAGTDLLTQEKALISAFPPELQAAIVPKAVKSDTIYNDKTNGNKTTFDKLWLFSTAELGDNSHPNEYLDDNLHVYQRCQYIGIYKICTRMEDGAESPLFTRTLQNSPNNITKIDDSGYLRSHKVTATGALSPCFCIGTADMPTAVLYEDGTMIFYESGPDPNDESLHSGIIETFTGWDTETYDDAGDSPWSSYIYTDKILSVSFKGTVKPVSTTLWFVNCSNLKSFDGNGLDMSNVTSTADMFEYCTSLTEIQGVSDWNVSNIKSMEYMFSYCSHLGELNLSNWNPKNVTDIGAMFNKLNMNESEPAKIYAGDWTVNSKINAERNVFNNANVLGYDDSKKGGNMCKPQSMGGYFTDPIQ